MSWGGVAMSLLAVVLALVGIELLDLYFAREDSHWWKLLVGILLLFVALICFVFAISN